VSLIAIFYTLMGVLFVGHRASHTLMGVLIVVEG